MPTDTDRLWGRCAGTDDPDACWVWLGSKTGPTYSGKRYGKISYRGRLVRTHVLAWILANGVVPVGHVVRHRCHNIECCNPAHLCTGTHQQNMDDMVAAGRSTFGTRNPQSKLTDVAVVEIRRRRAEGEVLTSIARDFGVNMQTISKVARGDRWRHV